MNRLAPESVLAVIVESGGSIKKTRLMKLIFLLAHESHIRDYGAFYDFLPYQFGPYSFFVYRDLRSFSENGLVLSDDCFHIPQGRWSEAVARYNRLKPPIRKEIKDLVSKYRSSADHALVDDVYERYPQFAIRSQRHGHVPQKPSADVAVYTMGYQGSSVDAFLHGLIRYGMARLIDVRNNPLSRRFGFSKKTLSNLCAKIGVEYIHIPELGISSTERQTLDDYKSYQILLDRYEKEMLPKQELHIDHASRLLKEKASVFVCLESDVTCCHRSRLANRLSNQTGLPVHHLTASHA